MWWFWRYWWCWCWRISMMRMIRDQSRLLLCKPPLLHVFCYFWVSYRRAVGDACSDLRIVVVVVLVLLQSCSSSSLRIVNPARTRWPGSKRCRLNTAQKCQRSPSRGNRHYLYPVDHPLCGNLSGMPIIQYPTHVR